MDNGIQITTELEAEDTLAVRLNRVHVEGPAVTGPVRPVLERQARRITDELTYLDGPLGILEVDGVSNAVQIRTRKPEAPGQFLEIILRNGNVITVEARGRALHVSRENYQRLLETLSGLLREDAR